MSNLPEMRAVLRVKLQEVIEIQKEMLAVADRELKSDTALLAIMSDIPMELRADFGVSEYLKEIKSLRRTRLALTLKALLDDLTTD